MQSAIMSQRLPGTIPRSLPQACIPRSRAVTHPYATASAAPASTPSFLAQRRAALPHTPAKVFSAQQVVASSGAFDSPSGSDDLREEAKGLRRISWISFWLQLALSIVSAIVLFFTASTASKGQFPQLPVFFNLGGVISGFISTFLAYSRTRLARSVIEGGEKVSKSKLAADILGATRINLFGLGLTIFGLQSTVGGLVGKALTSSSTGAYNMQAAQAAPAAIDVFAVQASTNTILLHFLGIVFANWTLRILNKDVKNPAAAT